MKLKNIKKKLSKRGINTSLNNFILFFILFLLTTPLTASDVQINAEVDTNEAFANHPLKGSLTITHDQNEVVDVSSIKLENKPIAVELVHEIKISPDQPLMISIYSFQIPSQSQGLHLLPPLSVSVAGKNYQTSQSSYEVQGSSSDTTSSPILTPGPSAPSPIDSSPAIIKAPLSLRLEALIDGKSTLYPGQRTKLVYRYYYSGNIDLKTEKLPLLDASGLIKIGEKEFKDYVKDNLSVSQISQEIEAIKPGNFSFGPSYIEGDAYQQDENGKKMGHPDHLKSEVPTVILTVLPFPEKEKPASFNGAIGTNFQFSVILKGSSTVNVEDEMALGLELSGEGNLKNVPLPMISTQPGFTGFFRMSDLPPVEEIKEGKKLATVELRPLSTDIKEIPSIEFSFFDPSSATYKRIESQPIPVVIRSQQKQSKNNPKRVAPKLQNKEGDKPQSVQSFNKEKVEITAKIEEIYSLSFIDLHNQLFGSWRSLILLPFILLALIFQLQLRKYFILKHGQDVVLTGTKLLKQAFKEKPGTSKYFDDIDKGLKLCLVEKKQLKSASISSEELSKGGINGEIREFLLTVEKQRFDRGVCDYNAIKTKTQQLFNKLQNIRVVEEEANS